MFWVFFHQSHCKSSWICADWVISFFWNECQCKYEWRPDNSLYKSGHNINKQQYLKTKPRHRIHRNEEMQVTTIVWENILGQNIEKCFILWHNIEKCLFEVIG